MVDIEQPKERPVRISLPVAVFWAGLLIALAITVSGLFPRYSAVSGGERSIWVVDHWTGRVCYAYNCDDIRED